MASSAEEDEENGPVATIATDSNATKTSKYSHPVYKQMAVLNGQINTYSRLELVKTLKALRLDDEGGKSVLVKRLKNFYRRQLLNVAGISEQRENARIRVMFDYYVVIDFEATCEMVNGDDFKQEIIEFPAVLLNCRTQAFEDEFRSYCRPVINPILSGFCTELTGITQADVDAAPLFASVLESFNEWLCSKQLGTKLSYAVVCDGPWDCGRFLRNQCKYSQVAFPAGCTHWVNVRKTFANFYKTSRMPLQTMLHIIGRQFEGRAHCGLDDARNIAAVVQRLLRDGGRVVFNETLAPPLGDADARPRLDRHGRPLFAEPVTDAQYKALHGLHRPNFPGRRQAPPKI